MGNFWDSLKSVGIQTVEKVSAPISSALGRTFANIVQGTQNKVAAVTDKIVRSTDPIKNANSPAIPPTTGSAATLSFQPGSKNFTLVIAAALLVAVLFFLNKRGS